MRVNRIGGVAAVVAAGLMSLSATATAAPGLGHASATDYPVTGFFVPYGASVVKGSITWHNRDVVITGEVRARSSEKQARFRGESDSCVTPLETRTAQAGEDRGFRVDFDCNYPGGLTYVYVALWEGDVYRGGVTCTRQGCVE
ncbi:hypothetical protein MUY14_21670 [Amycolatopsis sp. FBCC-B4732]|uniref:hypothetical protein n=1 Tax=Amycolatopsis sp. FBCC-B4732 TaxID=3079339 RepID=UPI001FF206E9|nr:hypothetical protein [Amycolatopsis sp. FBCC-B4732]UOX93098.1 hypothetical protein MUY14_21670 [Amycolatopsis sp. FBCC-B4732]